MRIRIHICTLQDPIAHWGVDTPAICGLTVKAAQPIPVIDAEQLRYLCSLCRALIPEPKDYLPQYLYFLVNGQEGLNAERETEYAETA